MGEQAKQIFDGQYDMRGYSPEKKAMAFAWWADGYEQAQAELKAAREENERLAKWANDANQVSLRYERQRDELSVALGREVELAERLEAELAAERTRREAAEAKAALADEFREVCERVNRAARTAVHMEWQPVLDLRALLACYDAIANQGKEDA